jgi:hypothetical protein
MELINEIMEDKDNFTKFYKAFGKNLKLRAAASLPSSCLSTPPSVLLFQGLVMCWAGLEALSPLSRARSGPGQARPG